MAAARHVGQHGQRWIDDTPVHDIHRLPKIVGSHSFDRSDLDDAGVVDQDVHGSKVLADLTHEKGHLPLVRYIARDCQDASTRRALESGSGTLEGFYISGANGYAAALANKLLREQI